MRRVREGVVGATLALAVLGCKVFDYPAAATSCPVGQVLTPEGCIYATAVTIVIGPELQYPSSPLCPAVVPNPAVTHVNQDVVFVDSTASTLTVISSAGAVLASLGPGEYTHLRWLQPGSYTFGIRSCDAANKYYGVVSVTGS